MLRIFYLSRIIIGVAVHFGGTDSIIKYTTQLLYGSTNCVSFRTRQYSRWQINFCCFDIEMIVRTCSKYLY
jgi:hypothetical protein